MTIEIEKENRTSTETQPSDKISIAIYWTNCTKWLQTFWHPHRPWGAVISKPHDLGFCFIATASTHKEFYGLMFAPQTNPASPAVFMYRNSTEEFLCRFDSRDAYFIAPSSFPGLPIFLPRCETWQTLVLGFMSPSTDSGSLTTEIILRHRVKPS